MSDKWLKVYCRYLDALDRSVRDRNVSRRVKAYNKAKRLRAQLDDFGVSR